MPLTASLDRLREACARIRALTGARAEESLYGDFQTFLGQASIELGLPVTVTPQITAGRVVPDYGLYRDVHHIGWVELKAPEKDVDDLRGRDLTQHQRIASVVTRNGPLLSRPSARRSLPLPWPTAPLRL